MSWLGRIGAVLLAVALLAPGVAPADAAPPLPHASGMVLRPCPDDPSVVCGRIEVPLYRARPDLGAPITVAFRIYPHTDRSLPPLEPIVAMEGGPGYGSIGSASIYLLLFGRLLERHDLLLMDQRGTGGSGAIDCPDLQMGIGRFDVASGACAAQLGIAAGAYGSGAAADDLTDILHGLGVPTVDVYGDSYGTYLAQAFAIRHPDLVRSVVLDAAFDNGFDPFEREASAALRSAWRLLCVRAETCPGILGSIARMSERLAAHPLVGDARDADGTPHHVILTPTGFATLVGDATYVSSIFRDLPAAMRSLDAGDPVPLLRLAAEDVASTASGGSPVAYSQGLYMAVSCHDYPTIWDPAAGFPERRAQLAGAIAGLASDAFAPFSNDVWLGSLYENELVTGCLRWPQPPVADPPFPPDAAAPKVPVLILDGEFDQATPVADARMVAQTFPRSTLVVVRNTGHISAMDDFEACGSVLVRRFVSTLSAGDTSCADRMADVVVTPAFPTQLASAPAAAPAGSDDRSTGRDRQAAWVAAATVGDALARWHDLIYGVTGFGLRGGRFDIAGPYDSLRPLSLTFDATRFVTDMAVSGTAVFDRAGQRVTATLALSDPGSLTGTLRMRFATGREGAIATLVGTLDGRPIDVRTPAPWTPQG